MEEQLVRVDIPLQSEMATPEEFDRYSKLEDDLDAAATKAGVGYLDGNDIDQKQYAIWLYGRDATKLAQVVKSALKGKQLPSGTKLFLRYGGVNNANAKEQTVALED